MHVLLIHGLARTPLSMWGLAQRLRTEGLTTELFGYAAIAQSYGEIVARLRDRLCTIAAQSAGDYGVVAHSLGGLLTRSSLMDRSILAPKMVVMLGTPNQSPRLARMVWPFWPFQWVSRDCGAKLASPDWYRQLEPPHYPYRLIAGTEGLPAFVSPFGQEVNDGLVALEEVKIEADDHPLEIASFHTFMMNSPDVQTRVVETLRSSEAIK